MKKIVFATGGTGGHIFPALAIADVLSRERDISVIFIGEDMESQPIASRYPIKKLDLASIKRFPSSVCKPIIVFFKSILLSFLFFLKEQPSLIVGMGSYASLPPLLAAAMLRIPIVIHEQNIVPGRVNRFLSIFARKILITFPETARFFPSSRTKLVGLPLRSSLIKIEKATARRTLNLSSDSQTILVLGGSRGAVSINKAIIEIIPSLIEEGIQVIHICGTASYPELKNKAKKDSGYLLLPFTEDMHLLYSSADLCIARAGASTLAELAYFALPSILIPYPYAVSQHQFLNALLFQKKGASKLFKNEELKEPEKLRQLILFLLSSPKTLQMMSKCAFSLARPSAAVDSAKELKEVMKI
ncbi:undecaprenyldiphospho-muramoylpentapeptide beta-N-acetylglucosaminyltransferase [bacterium]|nr:undecaprenyldiphospho-muramoylpentapeptide beta-N-acetylglucosaminyltransferase [bacterium]